MTTRASSKSLTPEEAEDRLKRATFRIYLGKLPDEDGVKQHFFGTGFFVSQDGLALSAYHNFEGCGPDRIFRADCAGLHIRLKWDKERSSKKADIAVLRLISNPVSLRIEPLAGAYVPAEPVVDAQTRKDFFHGRRVVIYGFPQRELQAHGWLVPTEIDEAQSIFASWEGDQWVDRLSLLGGAHAYELEGISGAPILDRELRQVIGVEGSYRPGPAHARLVYGTELAQLVDEHPELAKYFHCIAAEPDPPRRRLSWWLRSWHERRALNRYRVRLQTAFRSFTVLSRAHPLELERVFLELKVHGHVPPQERPDPAAKVDTSQNSGGSLDATEASLLLSSASLRYLVVGDLREATAACCLVRDPAGAMAMRWGAHPPRVPWRTPRPPH